MTFKHFDLDYYKVFRTKDSGKPENHNFVCQDSRASLTFEKFIIYNPDQVRLEFAAARIIQSKGHKGSFYLVLAFFSPVRVLRSHPNLERNSNFQSSL